MRAFNKREENGERMRKNLRPSPQFFWVFFSLPRLYYSHDWQFSSRRSTVSERLKQATILYKSNEKLRPPLPPILIMEKWRILLCAWIHNWFWGEGGFISSSFFFFGYSVQDSILDKSNEKLIPPFPFQLWKMARFPLRVNSSLIWGRGLISFFHSVQDRRCGGWLTIKAKNHDDVKGYD